MNNIVSFVLTTIGQFFIILPFFNVFIFANDMRYIAFFHSVSACDSTIYRSNSCNNDIKWLKVLMCLEYFQFTVLIVSIVIETIITWYRKKQGYNEIKSSDKFASYKITNLHIDRFYYIFVCVTFVTLCIVLSKFDNLTINSIKWGSAIYAIFAGYVVVFIDVIRYTLCNIQENHYQEYMISRKLDIP